MTETVQKTAMGEAFERAIAEHRIAPPGISEREKLLEAQLSASYEANRRLRIANGELKSVVMATERKLENTEARFNEAIRVRTYLLEELNKAKEAVARYNRRRQPEEYRRVYGLAFPDSRIPLPFHFGHTRRDVLRFARLDEPDFRNHHDADLEVVECLVRLFPGGKRVRVDAFDRKVRATDKPKETETAP